MAAAAAADGGAAAAGGAAGGPQEQLIQMCFGPGERELNLAAVRCSERNSGGALLATHTLLARFEDTTLTQLSHHFTPFA
jgi:hypothetical protein